MQVTIQELLERARECFVQAQACKNAGAKRKLELIGDQLLQEAHDLAEKNGNRTPLRNR